ncbi:Uncharacterized protein APZ42_018729 [Daphnia magna]|uniref:Uncharacterized protein n=1 Tax=Daphnia magna TaxID=35525 RepID=A0A164YRW7_9CRUS|nr:Uncharacterized protein APZ42_018729 [Daphnia magna]
MLAASPFYKKHGASTENNYVSNEQRYNDNSGAFYFNKYEDKGISIFFKQRHSMQYGVSEKCP